jgi:hypothetical protein
MLAAQRELQENTLGYEFASMTIDQRVSYVKEMVLAAVHELHEALDETTWKSWTIGERAVHSDRLLHELVDAWHFIMNVAWAAYPGDTADELAVRFVDTYYAKRAANVARQRHGYDGHSTKCPGCGRALDDVNVIKTRSSLSGVLVGAWCGPCSHPLELDVVNSLNGDSKI